MSTTSQFSKRFALVLTVSWLIAPLCLADDLVFRHYFDALLENAAKNDRPLPPKDVAQRMMTVRWPQNMIPEVSKTIERLYARDPSPLMPGAIAAYAYLVDELPEIIVAEAERQLPEVEKSEQYHLLQALCHARTLRPETIAIVRQIAFGADLVLSAPASAVLVRQGASGSKRHVHERLNSEQDLRVLQMCHALSMLPTDIPREFAADLQRLLNSSDLRVRQTAARAVLRFDTTNEQALGIASQALNEPNASRICGGYYYASRNGIPIRWYAASTLDGLVRSANVYASHPQTENSR